MPLLVIVVRVARREIPDDNLVDLDGVLELLRGELGDHHGDEL
jgi:hypothetical protein